MRFLVYAPVIGRGGVHRLVEQLIPAMLDIADREGIDIKILSHMRDENGVPIKWPEDRLITLKPSLWDLPSQTRRLQYLQEASSQYYKQLAQIWSPGDVVWLPHPWFSLRLSHAIVRKAPVHFVPTIHDLAFDSLQWGGAWGAGYRHEMWAFGLLASRLIFSSNTVRDTALQKYVFSPDKLRTVYLSNFLPGDFNPTAEIAARVKSLYNLPQDYFLAFHCSSPSKDLITIIRAIATTRDRNPASFVPLVIAGIGTDKFHPNSNVEDEYAQSIRDALRDANLKPDRDVFILGETAEHLIGGLYAGAKATITASLSEAGLSGTLFEAFYAKSPAIFSDIPQFIERLGMDRQFGVHFHKGNPEDLARAITELLNNNQLTRVRAQKAYELVSERTWQHIAEDYVNVFKSLSGIDPQTLRNSNISIREYPRYFDSASRFFYFRTVRFVQDRLMPKMRLSTHFRRMQAEVILTEVTKERNELRARIEQLEQENRQLQQKIEHLSKHKHE
jgi:glycosyltransferase involved in cell wall biosynthesis